MMLHALYIFVFVIIVFWLYFLAFSCNFDTSMCGFVQDNNDNFDWTRRQGSTPSSDTGPSADHTTGYGMNVDLPWLDFPPLLHLKIYM